MGKLKFRDFLNVDYAPGMPDIIKKNAKKRKADSGPSGSNAEYSSTHGPRTEKFDAYAALAKMAGAPKNPDKKGFDAIAHLAKSKDVQKTFKDKKLKKEHAEEELDEASAMYVIKHKKTRQVLSTHSDYDTAKDEHQGLGADKHKYGVYKQTKKDAALRNRNTYREEVEQVDEVSMNRPKVYASEEVELDEALTATQRRARARQMKRYKSRIKIGQEKAKRRMASPEKLQKRARKAARTLLFKKLTKGMAKSELTFQRRQEIEKRLDKMKSRIDKLARKLLPQVRKAEMSRRQSQNKAAD